MNRLASRLALLTLLFGTSMMAAPAVAHPSVDIAASNWKFTPDTVTLHVGETTQLRLTSTQGVHGIKSDDLAIPLTALTPGKFVIVSITPKKAGTYVLPCAIICGPGHEKMTLTVKVEGQSVSAVAPAAQTPLVAAPVAAAHPSVRSVKTFRRVASVSIAASNWKFTPNIVKLHVGQTTQLRITSTQGVHGIKSDDLGIPLTTLMPGKVVTVSVTPKKTGTYVLHCAIICGPGHEKMTLTLKV